jgi:dTDP-4-dehydrorhamnose 3,5-epimerase
MIDGVRIKDLKVIPDERGRLMEMLRVDDDLFIKFGQIYVTTAYPGVIKAWHYHKKQTDNMVVVHGMMKIVVYDPREGSPTKNQIDEFFTGVYKPQLIQIPPLVYHGFKCISETESIVINCPTEVYDYKEPDEFRIDPHGDKIPYDWHRKDR